MAASEFLSFSFWLLPNHAGLGSDTNSSVLGTFLNTIEVNPRRSPVEDAELLGPADLHAALKAEALAPRRTTASEPRSRGTDQDVVREGECGWCHL